MPRLRLSKGLPVTKLIEENMDSMASSRIQADLLSAFNRWEAKEDELKEFVKSRALSSPSPYREAFQYIYRTIEEIDKAQDELIEEIFYYAQYIYRINWLSNKILKRYDVKGYRRRRKVITPLFRGVIKHV